MLDDAAIRSIGGIPPGEVDTGSNPGCFWQKGNGPQTSFVFNDDNPGGLDDFYRARATKSESYFGYFEPTTINGFPAVFNDARDGRRMGFCTLAVGINDSMTLTVLQQGGDGFESCEMTKRAAEGIVATLQGAA